MDKVSDWLQAPTVFELGGGTMELDTLQQRQQIH